MYSYEKRLRAGIAALLCAVGAKIAAWDGPARAADYLMRPEVTAFLLYLSTGRNVRRELHYRVDFGESPPAASLPPPETEPEEPVVYSAEDISVFYACNLRPDIQKLLEEPFPFVDTGEAPAVLILSTHSTESYAQHGEPYVESADFRTLDPGYNMISIGTCVAERLEEHGIPVIQDTSFHDYPSYNGSYAHARKAIRAYLKEYPTIQLILDLHRDASDGAHGQLRTRATVDGADSAQLMLVMGTNSGGLKHDNWEQNLSLALKLQAQLGIQTPGITRPLSLRGQRFNQDLCPGAMLVEIGAAGNSRTEALRAAEVLADGVAAILKQVPPVQPVGIGHGQDPAG